MSRIKRFDNRRGVSCACSFHHVKHLITVPVQVNDSFHTHFIFDTGIGLNIISKTLSNNIQCEPTGRTSVGRRMSGQEISSDLAMVRAISVGSNRQENVTVGIFDMSGFPPELADIGGFLGLAFFEKSPFTIDYKSRNLITESKTSIASRLKGGIVVPVGVQKDGPGVELFLELSLPNGKIVTVEVDTGSDILILNSRFMEELGIQKDDENVRKVEGKDETGHSFTRYFTHVPGQVHLTAAPSIAQQDPDVMFQDIIYDGLLGQSFLKNCNITYDISRSQMIF